MLKMLSHQRYTLHHVAVTFLVIIQFTAGFKIFQDRIPNGNRVPDPCNPREVWGGVGHLVAGGQGSRNPFGEDFHRADKEWSVPLCEADSDGDGRSNGEELGDPHCQWREGHAPARLNNISHPGICDPWDSVKCQARNGWLKCDGNGLDCPVIRERDTISQVFTFPKTAIPARETTYFCQLFELPVDEDFHLVATEPILDNTDTVHHILMFGCDPSAEIEATPEPYQCAMLAHRSCLDIIATWTVGSNGDCLHDNVGFKIGKTGYRIAALQVHWNNPRRLANTTDSSGLKLHFSPSIRQFDAGMLLVGQEYLEITKATSSAPAIQTFSQTCPSHCTREMLSEPIFITATINHMHYKGVSQRIELLRNGTKVRDITYDRFYHYDNPVIYMFKPPVEVRPGDEIRTTCEFQPLDGGHPICFGDGTQDEMCYGFMTYYPKQNLPIPWCTARKSTQKCERYLPKFRNNPIEGCHWRSFLDPHNAEKAKIMRNVYGSCYNSTTELHVCTDTCLDAILDARKHPCFAGDIGSYIVSKLRHYAPGFQFLNALFTCDCNGHFDNGFCDRRYIGGALGENTQQMCAARFKSEIFDNSSGQLKLSVILMISILLFVFHVVFT